MVSFISMGDRKLEIIAKTLIDIGKAIFIAGIISNFFEKFSVGIRIGLFVFSFFCIALGLYIHPNGGKK